MKALVLEKAGHLTLRDIEIEEHLGADDVRIKVHTVGICGSDVHYFQHGAIGPFVVKQPMVLGHEASGTVIAVGKGVTHLNVGDRVCMEPGIPDPNSKATRLGMYNLDPAVRFWATPPVHGCLRETLVHPGTLVFKLPDNVGFDEGALVEPLAVGIHAARKAQIKPGDLALVIGAGTIGMATAMVAMASGCSKVIIADVVQEKLDLVSSLGMLSVNVTREDLNAVVSDATNGWGADVVFEASGSVEAVANLFQPLCPGGRIVLIGMPARPVPLDVVSAQAKEARIETVFRYAHDYPRALLLLESGRVNLKRLVTDRYRFEDSVKAFEYAANPRPSCVKIVVEL